MSKLKYDPKFFYIFKRKRYERLADLPDTACKSNKHKWNKMFSFVKWECSVCGAIKEVRPSEDTVLKKKLLKANSSQSATSPTFNRVLKSIERFKPSRAYKHEFPYQTELQGWLKQEFPSANIEKTTGASRPDIVIDKIAIEVKGPTGNRELATLSEKCLKYSTHYDNLAVVLFEPEFTEQRYTEIAEGIKKNCRNVRIIRKG